MYKKKDHILGKREDSEVIMHNRSNQKINCLCENMIYFVSVLTENKSHLYTVRALVIYFILKYQGIDSSVTINSRQCYNKLTTHDLMQPISSTSDDISKMRIPSRKL